MAPSITGSRRGSGLLTGHLLAGILANLLILGMLAYFVTLESWDPDAYYTSVQEDEAMEWSTFWGFMVATVLFAMAALSQARSRRILPWFLAGLGLFSFVVAMEEISWAQRLLGFRPPDYFLEHNYQQELNLHNVMSGQLRTYGLQGVLMVYGMALPLLTLVPALRRRAESLGILAPSVLLLPSFVVMSVIQIRYPWRFTGEIVEVMLGLALLFAAVAAARHYGAQTQLLRRLPLPASTLASFVLILGLGQVSAGFSQSLRSGDPASLEAGRREAEAIKTDFLVLASQEFGRPVTSCNLSKRLYSYALQYEQEYLFQGEFAALTEKGLPASRAQFFLDPWNTAWWIRDQCNDDYSERRIFVYSFGPNRRRDSNRWEILGDDVGAYIYRDQPGRSQRSLRHPGAADDPD